MKEAIERIDSARALRWSRARDATGPASWRRASRRSRPSSRSRRATSPSRASRGRRAGCAPRWTRLPARLRRASPRRADAVAVATLLRRARSRASRASRTRPTSILGINQDAMVRKSERARRAGQRHGDHRWCGRRARGAGLGSSLSSCSLTAPARCGRSRCSARRSRRIGEGDLAARARVRGSDEIAAAGRASSTPWPTASQQYRQSSLGELLQAQQASQAAIDSLPDPVLVFDVERRDPERQPRRARRCSGAAPSGAGDRSAALDPALRDAHRARPRRTCSPARAPYVPRGLRGGRARRAAGRRPLPPAAGHPALRRGGRRRRASTVVLQDVTRLLRFDELKNDLVATVAHEFRTPLTSLRMAIHLCLEEAAGPLTDKQADLLYAAREDCERLQGIVDDLLDLVAHPGRADRARRAHRSTPRALVDEARRGAARRRGDAGHRARRPRSPRRSPRSPPTPSGSTLVLANLLANAIRHTPAGRTRRRARAPSGRRQRALRGAATRARASRPSTSERIFERFFRVPGPRRGGRRARPLHRPRDRARPTAARSASRARPGKGSTLLVHAPGRGRRASAVSREARSAAPRSFLRLRHSVEASMPRIRAASSRVGVRASTRRMCSRSISSSVKSPPSARHAGRVRRDALREAPPARAPAPARGSRPAPWRCAARGRCPARRRRAAAAPRRGRELRRAARRRLRAKKRGSAAPGGRMSSRRSRSGGTVTSTTLSR